MNAERQTQITDRRAIADRFVQLTRGIDEITLQFMGHGVRYPVAVTSVDRVFGRCALSMLALADAHTALQRAGTFMLHARQPDGALSTDAMQALAIEPHRSDQMRLRCALPEVLTHARHRHDFRAALLEDMVVAVTVSPHGAPVLSGRLCNLSVGGGLIRLPAASRQPAPSPRARCDLQIAFPSGDTLALSGHVRRIYRKTKPVFTYVAIVFDADAGAMPYHHLWPYVCEIEREVARRQRQHDPLRPLAVSRLFCPPGTLDAQPPIDV